MSKINIGLEATVRQQIALDLGLILSDMYVLYTKTQNFHWNLIDPRFFSLHKLFEEHYEQLAENIDEVAERIRMLGEKTPGKLKQFLDKSTLKESDSDLNGDDMIEVLKKDHETLIKQLRKEIEKVNDLTDQGTGDLLIQCLRFHEKAAWVLRSHLSL